MAILPVTSIKKKPSTHTIENNKKEMTKRCKAVMPKNFPPLLRRRDFLLLRGGGAAGISSSSSNSSKKDEESRLFKSSNMAFASK